MRRLLNLNVRELKMEDGRWRSPESYAYSAYAGMVGCSLQIRREVDWWESPVSLQATDSACRSTIGS